MSIVAYSPLAAGFLTGKYRSDEQLPPGSRLAESADYRNMLLTPANFEKWAKEAGADPAKFKECYDGKKFDARVQAETDYGEKIGVKSTPTFFVNGQLLSGALPIDQFAEVIDDELDAKKGKKD